MSIVPYCATVTGSPRILVLCKWGTCKPHYRIFSLMVATHCKLLYTGALFWYCNFWPPLVPNPCFLPLWEPCHDGALKLKSEKTTTSKIVYCQKNCGENKPIITITSRQKGGAFCFHESKFLVTTKQNPQIFVLGVKNICLQIQVYILWRPFL